MNKQLTTAAGAALLALSLAACVSGTPGKQYDYSRAGFASDDGSR